VNKLPLESMVGARLGRDAFHRVPDYSGSVGTRFTASQILLVGTRCCASVGGRLQSKVGTARCAVREWVQRHAARLQRTLTPRLSGERDGVRGSYFFPLATRGSKTASTNGGKS
jgi:hypothetical protein